MVVAVLLYQIIVRTTFVSFWSKLLYRTEFKTEKRREKTEKLGKVRPRERVIRRFEYSVSGYWTYNSSDSLLGLRI